MDVNEVMHLRCAEDFGRFEKVSWVESCLGGRRLTFACSRRPWAGDTRDGRWKSQKRKNVYLSPYVEKPLNSKVIKSFVPELRSRKCFSCFEIPMLSICALWTLWTFCVPVWICTFHISVSGYGTYIYIYIYIYIDRFVVSQLFIVARHVRRLKLESKPVQLYVRPSIIPLS